MTVAVMIAMSIAIALLLFTNVELKKTNDHLIAAFNRSERTAKESERSAKQLEATLKKEIECLLGPPLQEPLRAIGKKVHVRIPADGKEVFLPSLDPHRVYQIAIQGICQFSKSMGWWSQRDVKADALYSTDYLGNFLERHDSLKLNEVPIRRFFSGVANEEDRNAHLYTFNIDGSANKTSARFSITSEFVGSSGKGSLILTIQPLPIDTPSLSAAGRREKTARETGKETMKQPEQAVRERARQAEEAAKENSVLRAELESLKRAAHFESHFLDAQFRQNFAEGHSTEILKAKRPQWRAHYAKFMRDTKLKTLAEKEAPEIIEWLEARVKIVQLAERVAVTPMEKETTAEKARTLMVHKQGNRVDDSIALARLKGEKILEAKAAMKELALDEDEKEHLESELVRQILEGEELHENGQGSVTL